MNEETEFNEPSSSRQKAGLLVRMAHAVEVSNSRRRRLHGKEMDSEAVDQLVDELAYDLTRKDSKRGSSHDESDVRLNGDGRRITRGKGSPVRAQQVQLLYTAMIRYRENADLRYQLLEPRHLDLSRSFAELEARYRHLENEQEAWKQSCKAMHDSNLDDSTNLINGNSSGPTVVARPGARPGFQNSTLPILQQELKMLSSQRNQLLQANLELRKQLKQMQIQMQTPKAEDSMTATCHRCHPELFAGRQQLAEEAFSAIVAGFQSPETGLDNMEQKISDLQNEAKDGELNESEVSEVMVQTLRNKGNTSGIHLEGDDQQFDGAEFNKTPSPTRHRSIVRSPPDSMRKHTVANPASPSQQLKPRTQMALTMNSILPLQQQPKSQQQQEGIQTSPSPDIPLKNNGSPGMLQQSLQCVQGEMQATPHKQIIIDPLLGTPSTASTSASMDRFGMLDDFGRSTSYRLRTGAFTDTNDSINSGCTAPMGNVTRFRRKSTAPPSASLVNGPAQQTTNRQRRGQRHSIATPPGVGSNAHSHHPTARAEHQIRPHASHRPQQTPSPLLANARHLEFSAPASDHAASPHLQRGNPRQPQVGIRRSQTQDTTITSPSRNHLAGRHPIQASTKNMHPYSASPRGPRHEVQVSRLTTRGHAKSNSGYNGSNGMLAAAHPPQGPSTTATFHPQATNNKGQNCSDAKNEKARPPSVFDRIKRTLQQEI